MNENRLDSNLKTVGHNFTTNFETPRNMMGELFVENVVVLKIT